MGICLSTGESLSPEILFLPPWGLTTTTTSYYRSFLTIVDSYTSTCIILYLSQHVCSNLLFELNSFWSTVLHCSQRFTHNLTKPSKTADWGIPTTFPAYLDTCTVSGKTQACPGSTLSYYPTATLTQNSELRTATHLPHNVPSLTTVSNFIRESNFAHSLLTQLVPTQKSSQRTEILDSWERQLS